MNTKLSLVAVALAVSAVPAFAQISTTDRVRDRVILGGDRRGSDARTGGTIGDVIGARTEGDRAARRVPRGHLPPAGMCRVWIDGVPPGRQPAPTTCAEAQRDRVQYGANARVIYGDDEAFPGKGKGKFKNRDRDDRTDIFGRRVEADNDDHDRRASKSNKGRGKGKKG